MNSASEDLSTLVKLFICSFNVDELVGLVIVQGGYLIHVHGSVECSSGRVGYVHVIGSLVHLQHHLVVGVYVVAFCSQDEVQDDLMILRDVCESV